MMKKQIYEALYIRYSRELEQVESAGYRCEEELSAVWAVIKIYLSELRELAFATGFSDQREEIFFFKSVKPKFYAEKIFVFELYRINRNRPVGTSEMICTYLGEELQQIHRFFQQFAFLYHYYSSAAVELDSLYFVRRAEVPLRLIAEMPDGDLDFSTAMDSQFAKFIAFERLQQYLVKALESVMGTAFIQEQPAKQSTCAELRWTGDSINLVELGYALHDTGQLNNGCASLTEIFAGLSKTFHVEIKKPSRRFKEIESRKRMSITAFIDNMRKSILNRIDRKNEYDPEKEQELMWRSERKRMIFERDRLKDKM
uniref:RteC domain-containing protein n=1 Tax=Pedobacter schmidteae TaxID=2201271 RepID=UPI0013CF02DD|nr:RteC domain-containing protein [Pedobacter schmidteae]